MGRKLFAFCSYALAAGITVSTAHAANHFVETFDTLSCVYTDTSTVLPSGTWTLNNVFSETATESRGGTGHAARINDDIAGAHLTTPVLNSVGTVSFYYRELNSGGGTFKVQKSVSGGTFTDVGSQAFSGTTYTFYTVDVNDSSSSIAIRILNDNQKGHLIIDDMTVTDYGGAPATNPPVLNEIGSKSVTVSNTLQFTVTATPTESDTVTLSASNLPSGAYFYPTNESGSFIWASATPTGSYNVTFYAADDDGVDSETITITVNPGSGGGGEGGLDISGWSVVQSNSTSTYTFPSGTTAAPNSYVIIGRYTDKASFETAWGVTLSSDVVYLNGNNLMPMINGAEVYGLYNDSSTLMDGFTPASLNPSGNSIQRTTLGGDASDSGNWSSSAMANATPGSGASGNGTAGLRISEYSDAGNYINEFVELYYDASTTLPSNQPPVLAAIGNKTTEELTALQFTISAADPADGDAITLSMSNAPAMAVLSSTNGEGTFTWALPTPDGVYTMTFYAADKDGVDSETITVTVTPPSATITSNFWHFEDDWQGWTNYSRANNSYNWSRVNFPGAESTAWKMEMEGTSSDDWLISPALNLSAVTDPVLTYWTKRSNRDITIQVKVSTNYPGTGDPLAAGISWVNLPYTRPSRSDVWAGHTNNLSAYVGAEQVYIAYSYSSGGDSTLWSVDQIRYSATATVESNAPPIMAPIGDKSIMISNNLMFPVQSVDPVDGDIISLTVSNLPAGAEFTNDNGNGYFTWVNASPDGVYTTTFHAADKDGFDAETITITVTLPPGPTNLPVWASIGNKSVVESNALHFLVSASDADGDIITLSASGLPSGSVFSATNENGAFHWAVPTPAGVYTTAFHAADNDGTNSETVIIHVNPVAPTGTIVFQGFDSSGKDTWDFSGGGASLAAAARTDGFGRQLAGGESLTFTNVSLIGHYFTMFHLHCASTGGIENFDSLQVFVALDGEDFPEDPDVTIQESNPTDAVYNATWPYSASGIAQTTAGTPATFYGDGDSGYSTVRVRIPDGHTNVSVKIVSMANSTSEYFHIDDVELTSGSWVFHDPPVLAPIGTQLGSENASLIISVIASDPDDDPITLSATDLPSGAVFMDLGNGNGNFTWANPDSVGSWDTTFTAETDDGSDSETVTLIIEEAVATSNAQVTIMAANISSGTDQAYHDPGIRIFQALKPDVVGVQEFNYASGARALVNTAFSTSHYYYVETDGEQIPNGIISRYPILSSGQWVDPYVSNRDMAWAIIDIPGTQDLYVVSVHLLTSSATERNNQATYLRGCIQNNWPSAQLIAIAGDLNTPTRSEACHTTLSAIVDDQPQSRDQDGDMDTNAGRSSDYDYVLTSPALTAKHTNTVVGGTTFANGIVFDTRLSSWGSSLPYPAQSGDSGVEGMQHMAVMKTFQISSQTVAPTSATIYTISGAGGIISPANPVVSLGASKTITISNSPGYVVSDVMVDGVSIGATGTYTFTSVTNNRSIAATFEAEAGPTNTEFELWMISHGWASDFEAQGAIDHDMDGALTREEYVAGTIPTNPASRFEIDLEPRISFPSQAVLSWPSATGRLYFIEVKSNVITDTWSPYLSSVPATPPLNAHTGTWNEAERIYFRIEVQKP